MGINKLKINQCDDFEKILKNFRMNYKRHSTYHFQVQTVHNFYPSKGTYYNSKTGVNKTYPSFNDVNEFLIFLGNNNEQIEIITADDFFTQEKRDELQYLCDDNNGIIDDDYIINLMEEYRTKTQAKPNNE